MQKYIKNNRFYFWYIKKPKTCLSLGLKRGFKVSSVPYTLMHNGLNVPIKEKPMKTVCGLNVHKDCVFLYILHEDGNNIQCKINYK